MTCEPSNSPVVRFDCRTTDVDAIHRAAYALADLMTIDVRVDGNDFVCSLLGLSDLNALDGELRLRREVTDQGLRLQIGRETEQVRNLVFAVAFSRTGLVGDDLDPTV